MKLENITVGMYATINKPSHQYDGFDGKVLSIYSDYAGSKVVNIKLSIEDDGAAIVVGQLMPEDLSA